MEGSVTEVPSFTVEEIDHLINATAISMVFSPADWNTGRDLLVKLRKLRDCAMDK